MSGGSRCLFVAALALTGAATAQAQFSKSQSPLLPYTKCAYGDRLAPTSVDRAPDLPMARPVDTPAGEKRVSVADGYRVMLAFPNTDPFVNLKVEMSVAGRYATDKQTVLDSIQHMAANSRGMPLPLERSTRNGIDLVAINRPGLQGGTTSVYTFFDDKKGLIATAYILDQRVEHRAFKDFAEFKALRDKFVDNLLACMTALK